MDIDISIEDHEEPSYDFSTFRVLVVDDFSFISDLISSTLNEMGIGRVIKAGNGLTAKKHLLNYNMVQNTNNIDVVILDWLMPEMSGAAFLKWVRGHASDTIKFMPVIVCTAYTSPDFVEQARDLGATEVMVKPVSAEKLAKRIQHVIEHPRPFIKSPDFFGPDRRRKIIAFKGQDRRKNKIEDMKTYHE